MKFDATFWVAISFIIFFAGLIYLKIILFIIFIRELLPEPFFPVITVILFRIIFRLIFERIFFPSIVYEILFTLIIIFI